MLKLPRTRPLAGGELEVVDYIYGLAGGGDG